MLELSEASGTRQDAMRGLCGEGSGAASSARDAAPSQIKRLAAAYVPIVWEAASMRVRRQGMDVLRLCSAVWGGRAARGLR